MRKISTLKETHTTERITLEEIRGVTNEGAEETCLWILTYMGHQSPENLKIVQEVYFVDFQQLFRFVEYTKHAHILELLVCSFLDKLYHSIQRENALFPGTHDAIIIRVN